MVSIAAITSSRPSPRQRRDAQRAGIERREAGALARRRARSHLLKTSIDGTRSAPTSASTGVHGRHVPVAIRRRRVDDVQQQVRLGDLLERRAERGDQRVRQAVDEPDRVRHQQLAAVRQLHAAHQRIERDEQRVRRDRVAAGQRVEQRRLARVGVADERHRRDRRLVPPLAQLRRGGGGPSSISFREHADAVADAAAVGFELGFAGAAGADAAAQPRQRVARSDQPRHQVLELRELDLQLAFARPRAAREDVENELRAIDDLAIERVLEVAQLRRRQLVVEDDDVDARFGARRGERLRPCRLPRKVAGSGLARSCCTRSTTSAPAAAARPASSSSACSGSK